MNCSRIVCLYKGVYHQFCSRLKLSRWVFINPADRLKSHITSLPRNKSGPGIINNNFALHVELLLLMGSQWTEYIEYLGSELREQVS
jgi:hypothetical protein